MAPAEELGAYGFRRSGVNGGSRWLTAQDPAAPRLDMVRIQAPFTPAPAVITDQTADISLIEGVRVQASTDAGTATRDPGLTLVRESQRLRQSLGEAPSDAPVRAWVQLAWGPELTLTRLSAAEKLSALAQARRVRSLPGSPGTLLTLVARPGYRLTRPRALSSLGPAARLLCDPTLLDR